VTSGNRPSCAATTAPAGSASTDSETTALWWRPRAGTSVVYASKSTHSQLGDRPTRANESVPRSWYTATSAHVA
jgi:hypothetical protein